MVRRMLCFVAKTVRILRAINITQRQQWRFVPLFLCMYNKRSPPTMFYKVRVVVETTHNDNDMRCHYQNSDSRRCATHAASTRSTSCLKNYVGTCTMPQEEVRGPAETHRRQVMLV